MVHSYTMATALPYMAGLFFDVLRAREAFILISLDSSEISK